MQVYVHLKPAPTVRIENKHLETSTSHISEEFNRKNPKILSVCRHTSLLISILSRFTGRVSEGFEFISKPLKRVVFHVDLSRICFPQKEVSATSTALGS